MSGVLVIFNNQFITYRGESLMMTEKVDMNRGEPNRALTSPVWIYFKTCEDNPIMANCSLCGIRMSRGGVTANRCGTTNLRRHLLTAHKINLPSSKKKNTGKNQFCIFNL